MPQREPAPSRVIGRYALHDELATGGMASIHIGRLLGPVGFARTVVIKKLHPQFAKDPEFVSMFVDEARLAARIRHTNVVQTLDVVATEGELFLVMDYVHGESLSRLLKTARADDVPVPWRVVVAIAAGMLHGLHAAHEAKNERGEPLGLVHRDVSPQNVSVGVDGVARVLDFGVAKAVGRVHTTRDGSLKGKIAYMAPEQLQGKVSRQTDVFAASVVLWESLTGRRLFDGDNEGELLTKLVHAPIAAPSTFAPDVPKELDDVVLRGLERDPAKRFATAREMALALERKIGAASASEVGDWVEQVAHRELARRAELVAAIELSTDPSRAPSDFRREISGAHPTPFRGASSTPSEPPTLVTPPTKTQEPDVIAAPASTSPVPTSTAPAHARIDAPKVAEEPSSVGLSSMSRPPAFLRRRWPRIAYVLSAVVAVVGVLVALIATRKGPPTNAPDKPAPLAAPVSNGIATSAAQSATATEPSTTATTTTTSIATTSTTTTTTGATTGVASTASGVKKPKPLPTMPTTTAAPKPSAAPKPDCNPKYYFDKAGVKVWKPECF